MIYLDYVSTTPLDKEVNQMYQSLLNDYFANADSLYSLGLQTSSLMEKSRSLIADMLDVKPTEIFFTNLTILRLKGVLFNIKIEGNILLLVQLNIQVYTMLVFS